MLRRALASLVLVLLLAGPVCAQGDAAGPAPLGAHALAVGNATLAFWVGPSATVVDEDLALGESASIWFALVGEPDARLVAFLNVTPGAATIAIPDGTLTLDAPANGTAISNVSYATTVADAGRVNQSFAFAGELYREANGTLALVAPFAGSGTFVVDVGAFVPVPPAEPAIPTSWIVVGAAVLVVGGGAAAVAMRRAAVRRRMNEGPRRSQVMREMEMERKLERAKAKDPEQAVQIQQEIRQAESVREKRRELQILEARRADAQKTLDLLKKRLDAGGLTKLQHDNMAAKKREDLARIEAEIAQMESRDTGAAS